ncbi:hypothetical protein G4B88_016137 [Cannabis sativa]|uniref:DUF7812 domain-containing protein n=1 Tax=Cannabis sativa TaxID=3483 RepID=A0A7J6FGZ8_CANSA|nr:hypothetical protein G4B88_016137 [Cannabis sativa]
MASNDTFTTTRLFPSHSNALQSLISAFQSSKGFNPPFLKKLYCLLVHFSLNEPIRGSDTELDGSGFNQLAEILFTELDSRFEVFFSDLCDVNRSDNSRFRVDELTLVLRCCLVILTLLDSDGLLEKAQVLLSVLGRLICLVTNGGNEKKKTSFTFEKFVSRECSYSDFACSTSVSEDFAASLSILEPSDPWRPFLSQVLEGQALPLFITSVNVVSFASSCVSYFNVYACYALFVLDTIGRYELPLSYHAAGNYRSVFADELLLHRLLREYLMRVDSASSSSRVLFRSHFVHGYSGSVLEVISVHFILSLSDEQAFETFPKRLCGRWGKDFRHPELSLTAAISLLNPIVLSGPKIFQAHVILLVSEAIAIESSSESFRPNLKLMTCYLTAFEMSVILYTGYMTNLLMDGHPIGYKGSYADSPMFGRSFQSSFECYIQESTSAKIDDLGVKLDSSWNSHVCNMFCKETSELMAEAIAYINNGEQVVDESCKDDILSISSAIIIGSFSDISGDAVLFGKKETSPQDVYLLAALLKLMSNSMSAVIWCLRHDANSGSLKTLANASTCKEYDFIVDVIGCFQHFNASLPNQKKMFNLMKAGLVTHKSSKWILMHFQGLLSLCFASGIDFLVKNCVSMIMTLMNLYAFEDGSLDALRILLVYGAETISSEAPPDKVSKIPRLSRKIVSNIQKTKSTYLSTESSSFSHLRSEDEKAEATQNTSIRKSRTESNVGTEEETEQSCTGKIFLQCVVENPRNTHECDDLLDFIECKEGKDYPHWLKNRSKYRKWKTDKMAVLRWKKKKKTWKFMAGGGKA